MFGFFFFFSNFNKYTLIGEVMMIGRYIKVCNTDCFLLFFCKYFDRRWRGPP